MVAPRSEDFYMLVEHGPLLPGHKLWGYSVVGEDDSGGLSALNGILFAATKEDARTQAGIGCAAAGAFDHPGAPVAGKPMRIWIWPVEPKAMVMALRNLGYAVVPPANPNPST